MVLLVDDDPSFLALARQELSGNDFILEARSTTQAHDLVKAIEFSMALVDLELAGQSGFDLIEELHRRRPKLPIVAISGVHSRAALESAKELGAADVLEKPISREWVDLILKLRLPETNARRS